MSRAGWIAVGAALVGSLAIGLVACYNPNPADGAFQCNSDNGFLCPEGLTCDRQAKLCVKHATADLGAGNRLPQFDLSGNNTTRSCEQRVQQGAFSNLANLGAINTAGDETSFAINGSQIYWMNGAVLTTATLGGNKKSAGAAGVVTVTGGPTVLNGGSFAKDGAYWFAGGNTANGASNLYRATGSGAALTAVLQSLPSSSACAFFDPTFAGGDSSSEMYLAYPLAGCSSPQGRGVTVAQGALGRNLGAFYVAFPDYGYRAPFVVDGATTLIYASVGSSARLFYSTRSDPNTDAAWTAPLPLPLGAIGAGNRDLQAVVSSDCSVLYLVSDRAGGAGGADLWAADIAAQ